MTPSTDSRMQRWLTERGMTSHAGGGDDDPDVLVPADFFVLRSPLLPFDELLSWSTGLAGASHRDAPELEGALQQDARALRDRLRALIRRQEVREALFVGSPGLERRLAEWSVDP